MPEVIIQQETAVPVFIGFTKTYRQGRKSLLYQPIPITSLLEYEQYFGGPFSARLKANLDENNQLVGEVELEQPGFTLYYSIKLFFANGGRRCYVVSTGRYADAVKGATNGLRQITTALNAAGKIEDITLVAIPDAGLLGDKEYFAVMQAALEQCATKKDRFALLDVHHPVKAGGVYIGAINKFREGIGSDYLSYGAAYFPWLVTDFTPFVDERDPAFLNLMGGRDLPAGIVLDKGTSKGTPTSLYHTNIELYYAILATIAKARVMVPPSGGVAGVYVRVDENQGVWKAPVNTNLRMVHAATVDINNQENEELNLDAQAGKSINTIRSFPGKGVLIWGARTLAGNDLDNKYIPVRRLFITVKESIERGIDWVVLEPNNASLWAQVRLMIENYLLQLWRQGALLGAKSNEAFFVAVGLGQTMTQQDLEQGRMIVEIGLAVMKPAEFIILRIDKKMQAG